MNLKHLKPDGNGEKKLQTRWSYMRNTTKFIDWVNRLGIEKTILGRVAYLLETKFKIRRLLLIFLFSLILSFLVTWDLKVSYSNYAEGDLAKRDIKSPIALEVTDFEQAYKKRIEAEESVPPIYDFDDATYDQIEKRLKYGFRRIRYILNQRNLPATLSESQVKSFLARHHDFENDLGSAEIPEETFKWLVKNRFRPSIESAAQHYLSRLGSQKIVDELSFIRQSSRPDRVIVRILEKDYKGEEFVLSSVLLTGVSEVKEKIRQETSFEGIRDSVAVEHIKNIIISLVTANLTLNKQETEARRKKAKETVTAPIIQIKKGQVIVREGAPIQRIHIEILDELASLQTRKHRNFVVLVTAVFLVLLLLSFWRFLGRFTTRVKITPKDFVAMGFILFTVVTMAKFILFVSNVALVDNFPRIPPSFYSYIVPVSSGAMMVGLIIPFGEVVWVFSLFISVVVGLLLDKDFSFMIVTFTSSIVAARGVYGCKKREDLYVAGVKTGLLYAALIFCATLIDHPHASDLGYEILWNTPAGFLSGIFSCLTALIFTPLIETVFNYTTDIKLLELSNLNHPLLKELIVKAPGTYHHSLVVGSMCEAAAEEIGGNPLLAKVCAYYHDIGKAPHAQYFIENQRPGENRHDQLTPTMSKTVLVAHVKDGVELGLKYKLGKPIIDVIEQHHGTTLIRFFYHKAKQNEDVQVDSVAENEYRYPGPKPQFREAALVMLADSIEAAARSLDEPTPARLQSIVKSIVQNKFLDGQLDECVLTLKDLTSIENAFSKILLGIYHQRLDYPTLQKTTKKSQNHVS